MAQTREEIATNLAERWCGQIARRDDSRVARRLYRKQVVDGVYRLDAGALLDDFFSFLQELGGGAWLGDVRGTAVQRAMGPVVQDLWLYSLKPLFGIERMPALPVLLCSDAALMRLVGFNAQHVRHGVGHRGAAIRQGPRPTGPICSETLAHHIVPLNLHDLEALFNGVIRALAKTGIFGVKVTGIVDATDLETTAQDEGCGQGTRKGKIPDTRGKGHEIAVTVYGLQLLVVIDARTKMPLAATVVPIHEHEGLSRRALVTQARTNLDGHARRHQVVFDTGCWDGVDVWGLAPHGILFVVPARDNMAVTVDAQAQAAASEGVTIGRRTHTGRHGQGRTAWTARLATDVVGITGLTPSDPYGAPEHGRHHHRRDCQPTPIPAVVVRQGNGHESGPAGKTVFLTHASVPQPLRPFDDDDDRRLSEHGCSKERTQPWSLKPPPQKTARAVRVHVLFTVRRCALATAYRRQGEQEARGEEPVGWQRWRRHLLEQPRDLVLVFAEAGYGSVQIVEDSLLVGGNIKDRPPGIGTRRHILAKYGLIAHR
jgi:hypothetical protein